MLACLDHIATELDEIFQHETSDMKEVDGTTRFTVKSIWILRYNSQFTRALSTFCAHTVNLVVQWMNEL